MKSKSPNPAIMSGLLLVLLAASPASHGKEKEWLSFNKGLETAAKEKKSVLVDFYTDWCHWCKVMDEKTFKNKTVADKLRDRFVTVRIHAEDRNEKVVYQNKTFSNVELTQAFGIRGFPSLLFLDSAGGPITIIPGYVPPEEFIHILNYIDLKYYEKKMSYEEFKKKMESEKDDS